MRKLSVVLITLLFSMLITGCGSNGNSAGSNKAPFSNMEQFSKITGLNDIEWVNVGYRKNELLKNYPVTVTITKQNNPEIIDIFEQALAHGSYQESPLPQIKGDTILSIKLNNGKYIQTPFSGQVLIHPMSDLSEFAGSTGVLITPTKEFGKEIDKVIKGGIKINSTPKAVQTGATVRNKKLELGRVGYNAYADDPIFEDFTFEKGRNLQDYEAETIQNGKAQGIDPEKLRRSLDAAKDKIGSNINKVPVIIETIRYQGIDSFLFAFAWETSSVEGLGHIWVVVIDANSNQVLFSDHCG